MHVAYRRGSVLLRRGDEITKGRGNFGGLFPIDNALYSIAFGTHTKMAKPFDMPFEMMTWVGSKHHVFDGPDIPRRRGNFIFIWGGDVVAHCKVMGHSTVSCA